MSHIFNRSYHSIQGFDVFIDSSGDAEGNYTVISLHDDASQSSNNLFKMSMQPVGYFVYNTQTTLPEFRYIKADRQIRWLKGRPPQAEPLCGFFGELCKPRKLDLRYVLAGTLVSLFATVAVVLLIKHYRYEQTLACLLWKVDMKEVTLINVENNELGGRSKNLIQTCRHSLTTGGDTSKRAYTTIGLYRGNIVAIKKVYKKSVDITRSIRKELKQMREVQHENLVGFVGASIDHGAVAILTTYFARGSLEDVLANEDLHLDHMFISSLVSDILKGMIYLHDSDIISHGNLRSSNCLVDSRWVCKISDFGLHEFKSGQEEPNRREKELKRSLWRAPEILRHINPPPRGTQKGDVYSFGIVLYEIIGRKGPWGELSYSKEEIIKRVMNPALFGVGYFRPPLSFLDIPDYIKHCLRSCWEEDPEIRPDIRLVRVKLKPLQAGLKPNIFDNMLAIMEKYAYNLEGLVQERTMLLCEEKKKTDRLLYRMLPKSVADSLKRGEPVEAECFDCVTIFFSDLVGFTELCAKSTPLEVVEMLNDLYTCCDSIISGYDVYKVETIGDAYMVVSGLPIRNGDRHAGEIASLSLDLLEQVSKLEIRHRPGENLQFRIGIHSGQCVAGVVGLKMPRYCLFGDTVNTASRMESTGEKMKIHISETTYQLLERVGGYICQERGYTLIKGKGEMKTYWLLGQEKTRKHRPNNLNGDSGNSPLIHPSDVQPDLICSAEVYDHPPCTPLLQHSRFHLLNARERAELNHRKLVCNGVYGSASSDQYLTATKSKKYDYTRSMCFNCQSARHIASKYSITNGSISSARESIEGISRDVPKVSAIDSNTKYLCVCDLRSGGTSHSRGPQSAPHITFMQRDA
ncbi:unnamed protein product [Hermetia illucens]|uniref:Guanylate cyclase n=1 Tax=Hermetia illucens TaxID=343691 RepID=A0A7R8UE19_HERIL|nr:unnamed protein product [Hermetia illucens]